MIVVEHGPAFPEGAEPADRPVRAPDLQRATQLTMPPCRPGLPTRRSDFWRVKIKCWKVRQNRRFLGVQPVDGQ